MRPFRDPDRIFACLRAAAVILACLAVAGIWVFTDPDEIVVAAAASTMAVLAGQRWAVRARMEHDERLLIRTVAEFSRRAETAPLRRVK